MADPSTEFDLDAVVAETLDSLTLRPSGDGRLIGDAPHVVSGPETPSRRRAPA